MATWYSRAPMANSLFGLLSLLIIASFLPTGSHADCSTFTVRPFLDDSGSGLDLWSTVGNTFRISAVIPCTGEYVGVAAGPNHTCAAPSCGLASLTGLRYQVNSTLNITIPSTQTQGILDLVKRSVPQAANNPLYNFNRSLLVTDSGASYTCIPANQTQYWGRTPFLICADGILSGCSGDGAPADGTAIRACGGLLLRAGDRDILAIGEGVTRLVTTDAQYRPAPENGPEVASGDVTGTSITLEVKTWTWLVVAMLIAIGQF